MYEVTLKRLISERMNDERAKAYVEDILDKSLRGTKGKGWEYKIRRIEPVQGENTWLYAYKVGLDKKRGQQKSSGSQFEEIKDAIARFGMSQRFGKYPFFIEKDNGELHTPSADGEMGDATQLAPGVKEVADIANVKTWEQLEIPEELLTSDEALTNHPAFSHIYGRNAQIRVMLSAINAAQKSNGMRRSHCAAWGHAGCGKTTVLLAIEQLLGEGAVLRLDATSTTRAGLEKLFFFDLKQVPPIVVMEEIEKCPEDPLKIWLGALDDRGEIRKVNFRGTWIKELQVVFLCTVNNYVLFKRMMGSDGKEQGALASRVQNHIYFQRPDRTIMKQILQRDINKNGGNPEWIEPALDLAQGLEIDDPRRVLAFLAGGDRLLDGSYQEDILNIHKQETSFLEG